MRLVKLNNLNEMWELKKSYGENFIGILDSYLFYVIDNGNIVEINEEKVAKALKMPSLHGLKLLIAAMYMEKYENEEENTVEEEKIDGVEYKKIKAFVVDEDNENEEENIVDEDNENEEENIVDEDNESVNESPEKATKENAK
ncbi:hypothetical protein [Mycoplasmopsis pulmonis]|uniref:hypothetical protein n=1 Tax=Mycoplasmopsis pulmonis TaxID=2107 RepID=UPI002ACD9952|nr:hypothetical protein [Mycoplasmopsis pulmonis]MDZ7293768.1 hypothetical protein [Mycoplasmopsis pulmonis]